MNVAFIPIRCGSKSIPFKNVKDFCGKPLIYWNLKSLSNSHNIDTIYVATDCSKIKNIVNSFNFSKVEVYDRDEENASDTASTESVILEFINRKNFSDTDLFFLVQATSPLNQSEDFDNALLKLKEEKSDSLLTCTREKIFTWNENGTPINYNYNNRPRRQEFDGVLVENGSFYINSIGNIKKNKNRISGKISIYEMEGFKSVDIDEEDDWLIAENLMKKYILND